jgi:hypothetical protein
MDVTDKSTRVVLPLLKAPISNITEGGFNILLGAQYGSPTTLRISAKTAILDLREGDVVTLYTEVLMKPMEGNA